MFVKLKNVHEFENLFHQTISKKMFVGSGAAVCGIDAQAFPLRVFYHSAVRKEDGHRRGADAALLDTRFTFDLQQNCLLFAPEQCHLDTVS